ncbi:Mu transposase domain-containing protein [Streptomyces sp. NPDC021012]|uniref:Mu transposase domain-containing protein n=1 Tax=Streptomyces sp. NPDC021012 TaxID=3365107 RepID=UPI00378CE20C
MIGVRAVRDHAALRPLPPNPYAVVDRHLRHVGKDRLVAFDSHLCSVPARKVRHRQLVEIRASAATVTLHATVSDAEGSTLPAVRSRAVGRGARIVDEAHWDGLPGGHTRATIPGPGPERTPRPMKPAEEYGPPQALPKRSAAAQPALAHVRYYRRVALRLLCED